jgi:phosphate acyltransferase
VVLDIGANAECRPEFLLQFALMGSLYAQKVLKIANPRVGLISNGEEAGKGNQLVKDTYPLLAKQRAELHRQCGGQRIVWRRSGCGRDRWLYRQYDAKIGEAVSKLITTRCAPSSSIADHHAGRGNGKTGL